MIRDENLLSTGGSYGGRGGGRGGDRDGGGGGRGGDRDGGGGGGFMRRERRDSDRSKNFEEFKEADPAELSNRPRLKLLPRTKKDPVNERSGSSSIFGDGKPRDEVAKKE